MTEIVTPMDATKLKQYLIEADYSKSETDFLYEGFTKGFDLGYRGPLNRRDCSDNIPFTVLDKFQLWDKMMQEIE